MNDNSSPGRQECPRSRLLRLQNFGIALVFTLVLVALADASFAATPPERVETIAPATAPRTELNFDRGWCFRLGDFPGATMTLFDDSNWRLLNLPHDWSIEGPFGPQYASGTGYAPGGIGWYRKHFRIPASAKGKSVTVEFEGIYDHSEVWLNGQFVGGRPYGYSTFMCDLSPYVQFGSSDNVIAVRVDHSRFADSRWYTGSGIYRHVRLRFTEPLRVAPWGVFVTTPEIKNDSATIHIETTLENHSAEPKSFSLESELLSPEGHIAASSKTTGQLTQDTNQTLVQQLTLAGPELWTLDAPRLYTLHSRVSVGSTLSDETTTSFGIRSLRFDSDNGFFLNDKPIKLKGVCVHHEAGCLGAAVPEKVWERRLRTLQAIGVNAIRTSHNPPAPAFLDLCDRLGFLVKDEAFDEFTPAKNKWVNGRNAGLPSRFGYAEDFQEWSSRDVQDMVRRDRNHPCVIFWSIGNEIDYANDPFSHPVLGREYRPGNPPAEHLVKLGRPLVEAVKQLDRTRPVTAALATVPMSDAVGFGEILDAVGYNYQEPRYAADHAKYPRRIIFGSETSHAYTGWLAVRDNPYVAGQFLWTGIDYLGEAGAWPIHGSSAGFLDLCGFKKPLAWFRQSLWSDKPMVYVCASAGRGFGGARFGRLRGEESWNWPSNAPVTIRCFTTCPDVELFLNDKSIGAKHLSDAVAGVLNWEVPFAVGLLKAIGSKEGKSLCAFSLRTAGATDHIELISDSSAFTAGTNDICQVEFRITDAQGVRVPDATNDLTFIVDGPAELLGVENGDVSSPPQYGAPTHCAFHGHGLAILQSTSEPGQIVLKVTAPGLSPAILKLESK